MLIATLVLLALYVFLNFPDLVDSGKNLVKDLVSNAERFRYRVFTPSGYALPGAGVVSEPIYRDAGRFSPSLTANAAGLPDRPVRSRLQRTEGDSGKPVSTRTRAVSA